MKKQHTHIIKPAAMAVASAALLAFSTTAQADQRWWRGLTSTDFNTASNWEQNSVPGLTNHVWYNGNDNNDNSSPYNSMIIGSGAAVSSIRMANNASITQNGGTVTLVNADIPGLLVGEFGDAGKTSSYTLNAGTLTITAVNNGDDDDALVVGRGGDITGVFNTNSGSSVTVTKSGGVGIWVGKFAGATGTVNMTGGTISNTAGSQTWIGMDGDANWNQSGGTFTGTEVQVGRWTGFHNNVGALNLSGNATFNTGFLLLNDGNGVDSIPTPGYSSAVVSITGPNVTLSTQGISVRNGGGEFIFDGAGGGFSTINLNGFNLRQNDAKLTLTNIPEPVTMGQTITLFSNIAAYEWDTAFANAANGSIFTTAGNAQWQLSYNANDITITAVPEPATTSLAIAALLGGALIARRFRRSRS